MQSNSDKKSSCLIRSGRVATLDAEQIGVQIVQLSACAACHAKGMCTSADQQDKVIYVPNIGQAVNVGDTVNILMQESLGMRAVVLAYLLPIVVMLVFLLLLTGIGLHQALAGLVALFSLSLYYYILFLFRDRLKKEFTFLIEKTNE